MQHIPVPRCQGTCSAAEEFVPVLAKAAASIGVAGMFMEVHPDPIGLPVMGLNMIAIRGARLLEHLQAFDKLAKGIYDMKVIAVIQRYASTRLPGKPLADICGKPMIQHVYELMARAEGLVDIVGSLVVTLVSRMPCSFRRKGFCDFPDCQSGSDRVREVASSWLRISTSTCRATSPCWSLSAIESCFPPSGATAACGWPRCQPHQRGAGTFTAPGQGRLR